jgi:terminal uridylyltransferase
MAYSQSPQSVSPQSIHYRDQPHQRRHASKQRFVADLSQCLFDFVIQLLPTTEEMAVKEDVRKLLERLIRTIEPDSRLLSFGSTANGFSLRNSGISLSSV